MDKKKINCADFFNHLNAFKAEIVEKLSTVIPEDKILKIKAINAALKKEFELEKPKDTIVYFYNLCKLTTYLTNCFEYYKSLEKYDEYNTNLGNTFATKIKDFTKKLNIYYQSFILFDDLQIYKTLVDKNHLIILQRFEKEFEMKYFYKFACYLINNIYDDKTNRIDIGPPYNIIECGEFSAKTALANYFIRDLILKPNPKKVFDKLVYYNETYDESNKDLGRIIIHMNYDNITYHVEKILEEIISGFEGINEKMLDTYSTIVVGENKNTNIELNKIEILSIKDFNIITTNNNTVMSYQNSVLIPKYALLEIFYNTNNLSKYKNENFKFDEINPSKFENDYAEFSKLNDSSMNIDTIKFKLINNLDFKFDFKNKNEYENYFKSEEFSKTFSKMMSEFYKKEIGNKHDNEEIRSSYLIISNVLKKKFIDKITSDGISDSSFKQLSVNSFYFKEFMTNNIKKAFDDLITRKNNFYDLLMKKIFILKD